MGRLPSLKAQLNSAGPLMRFLYLQRIRGFDPPSAPLLDAEATAWLERQLKRSRLLLEFGSGGSTLLANRLGVPTISVESDAYFAATVRRALPNPGASRIVVPHMGVTGEWGMPAFFKRRKGRRYVMAPFPLLRGGFPDLVFVDGRYRVAAALESARRAAQAASPAMLMLDDYAARPSYHVLESHLGAPDRVGRAAVFAIGNSAMTEEIVAEFLSDPR